MEKPRKSLSFQASFLEHRKEPNKILSCAGFDTAVAILVLQKCEKLFAATLTKKYLEDKKLLTIFANE